MKYKKEIITPEIKSLLDKELKGTSKYELALDIGVSESTLYKYMNGQPVIEKCVNKIKEHIEVTWIKIK